MFPSHVSDRRTLAFAAVLRKGPSRCRRCCLTLRCRFHPSAKTNKARLRRPSQRPREPNRLADDHVHVFDLADAPYLSRVSRQRNDQRYDGARITWTASSNSLWINRYRRQRHRHRNGHLHGGAVRRKAEEAKRLDDGGRTESYDPAVEVISSADSMTATRPVNRTHLLTSFSETSGCRRSGPEPSGLHTAECLVDDCAALHVDRHVQHIEARAIRYSYRAVKTSPRLSSSGRRRDHRRARCRRERWRRRPSATIRSTEQARRSGSREPELLTESRCHRQPELKRVRRASEPPGEGARWTLLRLTERRHDLEAAPARRAPRWPRDPAASASVPASSPWLQGRRGS